ncbi:dihydropteroate synthase [Verrucomicrobiota bacterium]
MLKWKCRNHVFSLNERPLIMGILNVTPDSFSDGGRFYDREAAINHGLRMVKEGADIIDIGGESTRPGAEAVNTETELGRVIPVIEKLKEKSDTVISIDTMKAEVAHRAIEAGASIINDVSAMNHDAEMPGVAAETGAGVVLMHMKGTPHNMQDNPQYDDVVTEVRDYLKACVDNLIARGVNRDTLAVDPGIGFGKTVDQNVELLAGLELLAELGFPVVVGLSRKSFLGKLTGCKKADKRLPASLAALSFCALKGAHVMRVHDARESFDAVRVIAVLKEKRR